MKIKVKKFLPYIVLGLLLLQPILDATTAMTGAAGWAISPGLIVRGIFLVLAFAYLITQKKWRPALFVVGGFLIINMLYLLIWQQSSLVANFILTLKIFYLPVLIMFFLSFRDKLLNQKIYLYLLLTYLILLIIPALVGINIVDPINYDGKVWSLGLFSAGNDLSAVLLALAPIVLFDLFGSKRKILAVVLSVSLVFAAILIGTKAIIVGLVAIIIFLLIKLSKNWTKKIKIGVGSGILVAVAAAIIAFPLTPVYKNTLIALEYHGVSSAADILKPEIIDRVVLSQRPTFFMQVADEYASASIGEQLMGLNRTDDSMTIESDPFDIFFGLGIIGFLAYTATIVLIIRQIKWRQLMPQNRFSVVLLLVISVFVGHVLITPAVATIFALIFNQKGKT